jgi:hypothetical protein
MPFRLRTFVSLFVLTLVVLTSSAGCGRESEGHFPFAYVQDDCGPTDGLALHFYFTQKKSEAGKYEEPFLDISINENLPKSAPQDYSIRSGSGAVLASRCLIPGQCVGATSGTLHLTKFDKAEVFLVSTNSVSRTGASKRAASMLRGTWFHFSAGNPLRPS